MTTRERNVNELIHIINESEDEPAKYISIVSSIAGTVIAEHPETAVEDTLSAQNILRGYTQEQYKEAEELILNHIQAIDKAEESALRGISKEVIQESNYAALSFLRKYYID